MDEYGAARVFGGGLRVTTTIDLELQDLARKAIARHLTDPEGPSAALVAIDPRDGAILAMVGGNNYRRSQFNLAVQAERQPGSAFKPIVLATALREGIAPATRFESEPQLISLGDKFWSVTNYDDNYADGPIDLVAATTASDNSVYAQLTQLVGPAEIVRTAHALGIRSTLDAYFALGLGAEAVNPLEMARAYATFANRGLRVDGSLKRIGDRPRAIASVASKEDEPVAENRPVERQALTEAEAAVLTSILQRVVSEGTGRRAALGDRPAAGKTGTTENYGDAWFVGYTPQLVTAVWVGYPNKLVPMLTEFHGRAVTGSTFPAEIWKTFTETALRQLGEEPEGFDAPPALSVTPKLVVWRNGKLRLDNGYCKHRAEVVYFTGKGPTLEADCKPNEVEVPRVIGLPVQTATERLALQPLTPKLVYRPAEAEAASRHRRRPVPEAGLALDVRSGHARRGEARERRRAERRRRPARRRAGEAPQAEAHPAPALRRRQARAGRRPGAEGGGRGRARPRRHARGRARLTVGEPAVRKGQTPGRVLNGRLREGESLRP